MPATNFNEIAVLAESLPFQVQKYVTLGNYDGSGLPISGEL